MNIVHMFDRSVRNDPDRLALTGDGGDISYREA